MKSGTIRPMYIVEKAKKEKYAGETNFVIKFRPLRLISGLNPNKTVVVHVTSNNHYKPVELLLL